MKNLLMLGSIYAFLGVAFGAFGAHSLQGRLQSLGTTEIYKTGVQYHLIHALAILLVALFLDRVRDKARLTACGWLFSVGILIFSGSLYVYAVSKATVWAIITPLGGLCFLAGWALLAYTAWKEDR